MKNNKLLKTNLIVLLFASAIILCMLCMYAISEENKSSLSASAAKASESVKDAADSDEMAEITDEDESDSIGVLSDDADEEADAPDYSSDDIDSAEDDSADDAQNSDSDDTDILDEDESDVLVDGDGVDDVDDDETAAASNGADSSQLAGSPYSHYEPNQYVIYVNRAKNFVKVNSVTPTGEELRVKTFNCSCGRTGHATPLGTFRTSQYYDWRLMVDNTYGRYAVRFNGHIMFHSVPYLKATPDTLEWEEYNKLGSPASLGCVRMQVSDAKWIYDNCRAGTVVVVYDDLAEEDSNIPGLIKIDENLPYRGWDPTDNNPNSPWLQ